MTVREPLAHGVGSVEGLPLPLDLVLQAGAATVVVSFLIAAVWWRTPRLKPSEPRRFGVARRLRYPVLVLALYITGFALVGPRDGNPAAHALFVWLWVGLILISVVFGPVWRAVNPLRTIFTLLGLPRTGLRPLAPGRPRSSWPAAAFLLAFVWFELLAPHHGDPVAVGLWILAYGLCQVILALLRGEEWFARGDCFEVYSELAGRLSPIRHRQPLSGLAPAGRGQLLSGVAPAGRRQPHLASVPGPHSDLPAAPVPEQPAFAAAGVAGFIAIWWGSTVFDSVSASPFWTGLTTRTGAPLPLGTAALILLCALVFLAVRRTAAHLEMSLIPIAVGYTLAHYLSLLMVEAPRGVLLLFGAPATDWNPQPAPAVLTTAQIALILIGHAIGVIVAHDHSLATAPQRPTLAVLADELPMILVMIACTWAGLFLLFVR
ncbi:hypothetical protein Q0Z83_065970 [Actinoplanes sichuanensis]|uniref:Uncharacterized protein n=1 Tax=Actinoplanes sichuanensis TaxID=512349 RepID=A0ABW4AM77_9ACTN|nr:hypothetical protein [Actinoplanes sichuanensis]BEL08406.1 hypothetical protein Q0Z83_065970 [Actinoplanes sichuanensis]